jgi:hypothetical protein
MDVFALVPFFIMGTATLCGLSLLVCLVVLEREPARWRPAALPSKSYRRRKGLIGRHAPAARPPAAQARAPRKAPGTQLAPEATAKGRLGTSLTMTTARSMPEHGRQARRNREPSVRSQCSNEGHGP